jgi:hypothetical protein
MIISEYVEMLLTNRTFNKLVKKYNLTNVKIGDLAKIPLSSLAKSSHYVVEATCDYCGILLKIPYKRYTLNTKVINKISCSNINCSNQKIKDVCQEKWGVDNPFQVDSIKEKIKETLNEKYGVEHPMFLEDTKNKIRETCLYKYGETSYTKTKECKEKIIKTNLKKFGVEYPMKTEEGQLKRKITRIKNGNQIPDELVDEYRKYRLIVNRSLQRNKKIILENWNGYDYYDNEYIMENFHLNKNDRLYPHFDHKISVAYGFKNNIAPEIISKINNICLTKQWINGLKKEMNEFEFIDFFKQKKDQI